MTVKKSSYFILVVCLALAMTPYSAAVDTPVEFVAPFTGLDTNRLGITSVTITPVETENLAQQYQDQIEIAFDNTDFVTNGFTLEMTLFDDADTVIFHGKFVYTSFFGGDNYDPESGDVGSVNLYYNDTTDTLVRYDLGQDIIGTESTTEGDVTETGGIPEMYYSSIDSEAKLRGYIIRDESSESSMYMNSGDLTQVDDIQLEMPSFENYIPVIEYTAYVEDNTDPESATAHRITVTSSIIDADQILFYRSDSSFSANELSSAELVQNSTNEMYVENTDGTWWYAVKMIKNGVSSQLSNLLEKNISEDNFEFIDLDDDTDDDGGKKWSSILGASACSVLAIGVILKKKKDRNAEQAEYCKTHPNDPDCQEE